MFDLSYVEKLLQVRAIVFAFGAVGTGTQFSLVISFVLFRWEPEV